MSGANRKFINCSPLTIPSPGGLLRGMPNTLEPLAYLYDNHPRVPSGVLVRMKSTGRMYDWSGASLSSIDQRKAASALSWMYEYEEQGYDWKRNPKFAEEEIDHEGNAGDCAGDSAASEEP